MKKLTDISDAYLRQPRRSRQKESDALPGKRHAPLHECNHARRLQIEVYHKRPRFARLRKGLTMKNDRKSLLERIYLGEFYPYEAIVSSDPQYKPMSRKAGDEIEYITGRLTDEDKERFNKLLDLMAETQQMDGYANFAYGFRAGMSLLYELITAEDTTPFCRE